MSLFATKVAESVKKYTAKLTIQTPTNKPNSNPPSVERRVRHRRRRLDNILKSLG